MSITRDTDYQKRRAIGEATLTNPPQTVEFLLGETWYPIPGTYVRFNDDSFGLSGDTLTYSGNISDFTFIGVSDAEVTENVERRIMYGLFRNEEVDPVAHTPHDFYKKSASATISAVGSFEVKPGDYFQVKVKTSAIGANLIVNSLTITLQER